MKDKKGENLKIKTTKIEPNKNEVVDDEKFNNYEKKNCKLHIMPPKISDADIDALFAGLVSIIKRKIELEARSELLNATYSIERLTRALKAKQAECARLKNEIINLKSQLN